MSKVRYFAFLVAFLLAAAVAEADGVTISGSGTWGSGAPVSNWSAPNETWSFSFTLPSPTPATSNNGTAEMLVTDILSFTYTLNGAAVTIPPADILFFPANEDGGFDIDFTAGGADTSNGITCSPSSPCAFNVFGNTLFTGTAPFINVQSATVSNVDFDYTASIGQSETNPAGTGSVTTFTVTTPEPAAVSLLAIGLLALSRKRKKN